MSNFLDVAIQAAKAAETVIQHHYRQHEQNFSLKTDDSPVTEADIETEHTIREIIHSAFPDHGFFGEETGKTHTTTDYLWLVDPIDGTRSFIRRYPFFSTQIALMHRGKIIVGVSNAPLFKELAWAETGHGAYLNNIPLQVSSIDNPRYGALSLGNIKTLTHDNRWQSLGKLIDRFARTRGYGDFYHYHLLAAGKIDLVIESDVNILDIAALSLIVEEAGGQATDLDGGPITLDCRTMVAGNPTMHSLALKKLKL